MIRLVAYDTNDNQTILDTFGGESVPLTLNVDDLRDIGSKNGGYSKDFDLPYTKNNNKFFNHIYDLQVDSTYNPFTAARAELYINENLVFKGGLYLVEFVNKQNEQHYKVNLFSNTVQLLDILGEATLNYLDFTDLNHTFTEANVINSWGTTGVTLTAGGTSTDVHYPLMQTTGILSLGSSLRIISPRNYTPFVRLKYLLDKIFEFAGFTYDSTFFNSAAFTEIYQDTGLADFSTNADIDEAYIISGKPFQSNSWTVGDDDYNIIDSVQDPEQADTPVNQYQADGGGAPSNEQNANTNDLFVPYVKVLGSSGTVQNNIAYEIAPFAFDNSNLYNNGVITAPSDNFTFVLEAFYPIYGAVGTTITIDAEITSGSSSNTINIANDVIDAPSSFYGLTNNFEFTGIAQTFTLDNAGDTFAIKITTSATAYLMPYYLYYDTSTFLRGGGSSIVNGVPEASSIARGSDAFVYIEPIQQNASIDDRIKNNHGEVKLKDIFTDITKLFNLYVDNTENDRQLKIEPYNDYIATGTTLDWTKKADLTEVVNIYTDLPSKLTFRYNNDEDDHSLNTYKKNAGIEYGRMDIQFATDKTEERVIMLDVYSATALTFYSHPFSTVVQRDEAGVYERLKNKPRLLYKNGEELTTATDDLVNIVDHTSYVMASHYNNEPDNIGASTLDLNFGFTMPVLGVTTTFNTTNNLFNKYYYRYVIERYTEDRTFIKLNIKLSPVDIAAFRFNQKIRIQNQTYIVNKIEYNAGEFGMSKVELVKI
jgi:hypothetical protein